MNTNIYNNIKCKLINTEANRILVDNSPHKPFLDLSIVYYIDLDSEYGTSSSTYITYAMLEILGLTLEELDTIAMRNLKTSKPRIEPMFSRMLQMVGLSGVFDEDDFTETERSMFILSNAEKTNGAISILNRELLADFAQKQGTDLWLIPSSIHEFIIIPDCSGICPRELNKIIEEINRDESLIRSYEVLSDHCYFFSKKTNSITSVA